MAFSVICFKCKRELIDKGALLISPPDKEGRVDKVYKAHLCLDCYKRTISWIATDIDDPSKYADNPIQPK